MMRTMRFKWYHQKKQKKKNEKRKKPKSSKTYRKRKKNKKDKRPSMKRSKSKNPPSNNSHSLSMKKPVIVRRGSDSKLVIDHDDDIVSYKQLSKSVNNRLDE